MTEEKMQELLEKYEEANQAISQFKEYIQQFERIKSQLENKDSGIEEVLEGAKEKLNEITDLSAQSQETIENINKNVAEIEELLEKANILSQQITEADETVQGEADDIKKILQTAQERLQNIDTLLETATIQVEEIEKFYINFQKLKETIEDEETGVSALFDYIQEQAEQANNVLESIDDVRSKSEKTLALIEQSKSETDNMKHQISGILEDSESTKEEIKKYAQLITNTGFANSFYERKQEILKETQRWRSIWGLGIVLLVLLLLRLFGFLNGNIVVIDFTQSSSLAMILYRLAFSSPLLYLIRFAGKEYSKTKREEEKYAFKSALSQAYPSQIQNLVDKFGDNEKGNDVVLTIVRKVYTIIYTTPYKEDNIAEFEEQLLKSQKEKILSIEKGASKNSMIETIKNLKEIFGDDTDLLKDIIHIFNLDKK